MKRFLVLLFVLVAGAGVGSGEASEPAVQSGTLSPYFFIESEESDVDGFPLKQTEVEVVITGVMADVKVRQVYANMGGAVINGRYIFPGSTRAAVHGMTMTIGERVIKAQIKEKAEAKKTFEKAKSQGKKASLLEQKRPNVFSMEVANIMPGDTVEIELRYTELLVPDDGTYEFVYPTVVGPRYSTMADNETHRDEGWVKNPYLKEGSEARTGFDISVTVLAGMKLQELNCQSHDTTISYLDESKALIELKDSSSFGGDRDYILKYRLADLVISSGLILEKGEKENFFLLMAQPPRRLNPKVIPPREYSFVIDVSGSMHGFPLDTAKTLLVDLVSGLRPSDSFNVLLFAGDSRVMSNEPLPATPDNIRKAIGFIEASSGGGGTELLKAMRRVMSLPVKEGVSRTIVVATDGYINAEREVFAQIQNNLHKTNVFAFGIGSSVNRHLIEGMARSGGGEPFVVTTPEEAKPIAQKFREYIASPVLTDINIEFDGFEAYDIEPPSIPDLFAQRPVIMFGKFREGSGGAITISGKNGDGLFKKTFSVADSTAAEGSHGLGYLWARSRIARISDFNSRDTGAKEKDEIVQLGLAYNLLTRFTSFVAVDEVVRNPEGKSRDVTQPLSLPKGVSNLAVGVEIQKVPEPEMVILILLVLTGWAVAVVRRRRAPSHQNSLKMKK